MASLRTGLMRNRLKKLEKQVGIRKKEIGTIIDYHEWERMTPKEQKQMEDRYMSITIFQDFPECYEDVEGVGLVHIWELENYTNKEENL